MKIIHIMRKRHGRFFINPALKEQFEAIAG
jgi:hypothetical protein